MPSYVLKETGWIAHEDTKLGANGSQEVCKTETHDDQKPDMREDALCPFRIHRVRIKVGSRKNRESRQMKIERREKGDPQKKTSAYTLKKGVLLDDRSKMQGLPEEKGKVKDSSGGRGAARARDSRRGHSLLSRTVAGGSG